MVLASILAQRTQTPSGPTSTRVDGTVPDATTATTSLGSAHFPGAGPVGCPSKITAPAGTDGGTSTLPVASTHRMLPAGNGGDAPGRSAVSDRSKAVSGLLLHCIGSGVGVAQTRGICIYWLL